MGTCGSHTDSVFYLLKRCFIMTFCAFIAVGCSTNQTNNQISSEQTELYEGQPILAYLAKNQSKTPEEAIARAKQAQLEQDTDRALFEFIRAYELDAKHTEALLEIAGIHYSRNNLTRAYLAYQRALSIDPELTEAHQGSGLILLRNKKYNLALDSFNKAIEFSMKHQSEELASTEEKTLSGTTAEITSSQTKTVQPTQILESYNGIGIISDIKGMYKHARINYQAALKINAQNKKVLNNLGYSFYLESNWRQAEAYFIKALNIDSSYQAGWKNLGLVYARQEKYLQALEALEQVMETSQAYNDIGYICLLSKRYKQAAYFFRQAISENPQYYEVAQQNLTRVKRLLAVNPDGKSKL